MSTIEEGHREEKASLDAYLRENERLKQEKVYTDSRLQDLQQRLRSMKPADVNEQPSDESIKQAQMIHSLELREKQLENDLLRMKSFQERCLELQATVDRLQSELQLNVSRDRENVSAANAQLRTEMNNAINASERVRRGRMSMSNLSFLVQLTDECEQLRRALIAKSDEFDSKQHEVEQLRNKNADLEANLRSLREHRPANVDSDMSKQDDFDKFQRVRSVTRSGSRHRLLSCRCTMQRNGNSRIPFINFKYLDVALVLR